MPKVATFAFALLIVLAITSTACSTTSVTPTIVRLPTTTLVPTPPPLPTPVPATATLPPTPTATATWTVLPTDTPTLALNTTPTSASAPTSTATPTATATRTAPPTLSPTPAAPGGLFVTSMRVEPNPVRGQPLTFYPTFFNNTGSPQNIKWVVYIYRSDTPNRRIAETTALYLTIPPGTFEQKGLGTWKLDLGGPCDYFYAEVAFFDANNRGVSFTTPDGTVYQKGLTLCPP